ncbi:MAG: TIR domain-containing protein [Clostridia bacterium]|nr:TIR domain-containing protein [Clostridia bacterium]
MSDNKGKLASFVAFISHKGADSKFALKIQKFIESYNLPVSVRKRTGSKRRLTPLCAYEVDFSSNPLYEEMEKKLSQSQYLILICSEAIFKSDPKYVNFEIETFIRLKEAEGVDPATRIIPIVLDDGTRPATSYLPEPFRALGEKAPIALRKSQYKSERELFLHVISSLLKIDYAVLRDRDSKRRIFRAAATAGIATAVAALSILLGLHFIPRDYHYHDFVMKNGIPVGIDKLSRSEYEKSASHYVITKKEGRVIELSHVDSYGNLKDHSATGIYSDRPARYSFEYTTDRSLSAVTYYNKFDIPYFTLQYSGEKLAAADLKHPKAGESSYLIPSGYEADGSALFTDINESARTGISRFKYEYNDEGYVTRITFHADSSDRLAHDSSVFGFEFELDELGRVEKQYFLDADYNRRPNSQGIYYKDFKFDSSNDMVELSYYGIDGELICNSDGFACAERTFDSNHNTVKTVFTDENGDITVSETYGGAIQEFEYDERGLTVSISVFDENGDPSDILPYCTVVNTYNQNGLISSRTYADEDGDPVMVDDVNYAVLTYEYDENGFVIKNEFLDDDGELCDNIAGYAIELTEYNSYGQPLKITYLDSDEDPADYYGHGFSSVKYEYDELGRLTHEAYFDEDEEPTDLKGPEGAHGFHAITIDYGYGLYTEMTTEYLDKKGKPTNYLSTNDFENYSRSEIFYQNGYVSALTNYDKDGNIYGDYIEFDTEYTAKSQLIETSSTYSSDGVLLIRHITTYDIRGVISEKVSTQYENGNLVFKSVFKYHSSGLIESITSTTYTEDGEVATESTNYYNDSGLISHAYFTDYGPDNYPYGEIEYSYDDQNTLLKKTSTYYTEIDGGIIGSVTEDVYNKDGLCYLKIINSYDESEKISATQEYEYNDNGHLERMGNTIYNSNGEITSKSTSFFSEDADLTSRVSFYYYSDGSFSSHEYIYKDNGNYTYKSRIYDENGELIREMENEFDKDDNLIG